MAFTETLPAEIGVRIQEDAQNQEHTNELRALDVRIARHLGWERIRGVGHLFPDGDPRPQYVDVYGVSPLGNLERVPRFTADIAAAWTLLAKLEWSLWSLRSGVTCSVMRPGMLQKDRTATSAPLAICRAYEAAFLVPDSQVQQPAPTPTKVPTG